MPSDPRDGATIIRLADWLLQRYGQVDGLVKVASWVPAPETALPLGFLAEAPGDSEVAKAVAAASQGLPCPGPLRGRSGWRHEAILREVSTRIGGEPLDRDCMYHGNVFDEQLPSHNNVNNTLKPWLVGKQEALRLRAEQAQGGMPPPGVPRPLWLRHGDHVLRVTAHPVEGGFLPPAHWHHLVRMCEELRLHGPKVLVLYGETAVWALTGRTGMRHVRGNLFELQGSFVPQGQGLLVALATYHPANTFHQQTNLGLVVQDVEKAALAARGGGTVEPSGVIAWLPEDLNELEELLRTYVDPFEECAWDTETTGKDAEGVLTAVQVDAEGEPVFPQLVDGAPFQVKSIQACADATNALVIPFLHPDMPGGRWWPTPEVEARAWAMVAKRLEGPDAPRAVWQNGASYDLGMLRNELGIQARLDDDTMLMMAVHDPGAPKDLSSLAARFLSVAPWKVGMMPKRHD